MERARRKPAATIETPILVLQGDDLYHPQQGVTAARRGSRRAATLIERWKEPADQPAARAAVDEFLAAHVG